MTGLNKENILNILGEQVMPGESRMINVNMAKLYTTTSIEIPIIVERSKKPGPCVLLTAGIHGDEITGIEIIRRLIEAKVNKPTIGTIICIPVLNVFGFINKTRAFPDGRDLNRVFPGTKNGSLASRFAHIFATQILPCADFCLDFHAGGDMRFNISQIRIDPKSPDLMHYARIFNPPFIVHSGNIAKTYRSTCDKQGIPILLFEGGKSETINSKIATEGVEGTKRILQHFKMLKPRFNPAEKTENSVLIKKSQWLRAKYSGLLHTQAFHGDYVTQGQIIAWITDPYGSFKHHVKAPSSGYLINVNKASLVYQGDAIFHISTIHEKE